MKHVKLKHPNAKPVMHKAAKPMHRMATKPMATKSVTMPSHIKVRVKSSNPVIVDNRPYANQNFLYGFQNDGFVSFDSTDSSVIMQFQEWYNVNRKGTDPAQLTVDGIFGPLTSAAYGTDTGKAFDTTLSTAKATKPNATAPATAAGTPTPTTKKDDAAGASGMSLTTKLGIAAAGALIIIIIIMVAEGKGKTKTANI